MYRHPLIHATRAASRPSSTLLSFSTSSRALAGGDTGAPRSGGAASGDAFTKREKGMEDYAIREREKEKARELLAKVKVQEDSLKKIREHLENLQKDNGQQREGNPSANGAGKEETK